MHWPQYAIAVYLVFAFINIVVTIVRRQLTGKLTRKATILGLAATTVFTALFVYTLHAGGFW